MILSTGGNIVRRNKFRRFYQVEQMAQKTSVNGIYLVQFALCFEGVDQGFREIESDVPLAQAHRIRRLCDHVVAGRHGGWLAG